MSVVVDETVEPVLDGEFGPLVRDARRYGLGRALIAVGGWHLIVMLGCEWLFGRGDRVAVHFLPLWLVDAVGAFVRVRRCFPALERVDSGRSVRLGLRIWLTFAILCMTSASLNSITGFAIDWFKISWAILGTFGFAMMAWSFHLAFLLPAVQMSLTGLLIAAYPDHAYALFGASWFLVLGALGLLLDHGQIASSAAELP